MTVIFASIAVAMFMAVVMATTLQIPTGVTFFTVRLRIQRVRLGTQLARLGALAFRHFQMIERMLDPLIPIFNAFHASLHSSQIQDELYMPMYVPIRKPVVPRYVTIFLACSTRLCESTMRLMGTNRLERLAAKGAHDLSGRIMALAAELRAAEWSGPQDPANAFPSASVDGGHVTIPIDDDHCVTLLVHYGARLALVEAAGPSRTARANERKRQ